MTRALIAIAFAASSIAALTGTAVVQGETAKDQAATDALPRAASAVLRDWRPGRGLRQW
jgi:hypothetical protein